MSVDVRQREYGIGMRDSASSVLETAYLRPCIAFYGVDAGKGIAFLCHLDAHACGLRQLINDLKKYTDGDLSGFKLYIATGINSWWRLVVGLLIGLFAHRAYDAGGYVAVGLSMISLCFFFSSRICLKYQLWQLNAFCNVLISVQSPPGRFGYRMCGVKVDANTMSEPLVYADNSVHSHKRFKPQQNSWFFHAITKAEGSA